jgi:hypothetical protein
MTTGIPTTPDSPAVVDLAGGRVTLEPIEQLEARRIQRPSKAADLHAHDAQLIQDAATHDKEAGAILVAQRGRWTTAGVTAELATIDQLTGQIDNVDAQLAEVSNRVRHGLSGFFKRFGDRHRRAGLIKQRDALAARVAWALQMLGEHAPQTTFTEADALLMAARSELVQAAQVGEHQRAEQAGVEALSGEIRRRREAINKMGFDALQTAAWLQNHEPQAIDSPASLKRGEVAWLSVGVVLSRLATRTQWTGSNQGVSFPITHTGIQYRVGSYRGSPIRTNMLKDIDSGSLVLTNQRLVFVARLKSVTIALLHIVHVDAYTDALGVFQDKRKTPDVFKLHTPQHVPFYINYALVRLR